MTCDVHDETAFKLWDAPAGRMAKGHSEWWSTKMLDNFSAYVLSLVDDGTLNFQAFDAQSTGAACGCCLGVPQKILPHADKKSRSAGKSNQA